MSRAEITFGVTTWLWTSPFRTDDIRLFPKIKALGFDFLELAVEDPALIDAALVRQALSDHGLSATMAGAFGPNRDLTSDNPALRTASLAYIRSCVELAEALGITRFGGPMYSAVGKRRLVPPAQREQEWQLAVQGLRQAAPMADDHGVKLAIEPINRFETDLVNTAEAVMRMVGEIDHAAVGVQLDSFHLTLEERDLEQAIRLCGPKLLHVQVSENYRGAPGSGQTRWDAFKRGLDAIGYRGGIAIESFTPAVSELADAVCIWRTLSPTQDEFARAGLAFLRQLFTPAAAPETLKQGNQS